jgi:hypothetical protein
MALTGMVLGTSADEFLRRFLLHLQPRGLVRIRNFGFLANRQRAKLLPLCFRLLRSTADRTSAGVSDHPFGVRQFETAGLGIVETAEVSWNDGAPYLEPLSFSLAGRHDRCLS